VGYGYIPLFVLLIVALQGGYWWMNRDKKK